MSSNVAVRLTWLVQKLVPQKPEKNPPCQVTAGESFGQQGGELRGARSHRFQQTGALLK